MLCQDLHKKAVSSCAAHEHALNADALTIVSHATRQRVIHGEEAKLHNLKASCIKIQKKCAYVCDEELENASIDGKDLSLPLERLNDCRQGQVALQIRAINKKIQDLRRVMGTKTGAIKNAANSP